MDAIAHVRGDLPRTPSASMRMAAVLAVCTTAVVTGVWLWSRICEFPVLPWNDIRLAPAIARAQGWMVYPTAEMGTINTWSYGPLPLLFFWPASWASTAAEALGIASALNMALTLVPLALVCFTWPAANGEGNTPFARAIAFLLCIALWPARNYETLWADNLAIACGLIGNLMLVRAHAPSGWWFAACVSTAAIACKQTAVGIPLAQVAWLALTTNRAAAWRHAVRCAVSGAAIGAVCVAGFGWPGLRFVLLELPAHFRWAPDPLERLLSNSAELALHVGVPAVALIFARGAFQRPALLLPALAWVCTLPFGAAALLKFGGRMNSLYSFTLWLPPVLVLLLTSSLAARPRRALQFVAIMAAMACMSSRIVREPVLFLQPQFSSYREAQQLATQFRGQIWFPLNPLVTLYSEGRYYHDEDGLYVRATTHKEMTPAHLASHLPPAMRAIAFHERWTDWGIARRMIKENPVWIPAGKWTLLTQKGDR